MPLDVLGRTRATIKYIDCPLFKRTAQTVKICDSWDCRLKLFDMNLEFLVNGFQQKPLIKSLPFVHTARRYYRLNDLVRMVKGTGKQRGSDPEAIQTVSFRGSKSRNKVSVGEPSEGS